MATRNGLRPSVRSVDGWIVATIVLVALTSAGPALAAGKTQPATAAGRAGPVAGATRIGSAPTSQPIAVVLPLRTDEAGLARFATAVSTPGSGRYGQYEPVATLARRFGASAAERARVVRYLRRAGARDVSVDVTGLFADATLSVGQAQKLFGTSLAGFRSADAARFIAPTGAARVPAGLTGAVTGVVGLDTQPLSQQPPEHASARAGGAGLSFHRPGGRPSTATTAALPTTTTAGGRDFKSAYAVRSGTPAGCPAAVRQTGFTPNQYLTAYGYTGLRAAGIDGRGERVALIEIDGFRSSDVRTFARCFGLPHPPVSTFRVGIRRNLSAGGEATLDLELLDAAAPNLRAVDVYESRPMAADVLKSLTRPLRANRRPDVISASLGSCELATFAAIRVSGIRTVEASLQMAAASGISVLASSGDSGSTACLNHRGNPVDLLAVNYPASSPWVTGVGGTNVLLNAQNLIANPATDQIVWNDAPLVIGASGGGMSGLFRRPSYQRGFSGTNRRVVPDVSMLADPLPGYEIYCTARRVCVKNRGSNPWVTFGGTSAATPLLAGGFALVDQALRRDGRHSLGFANPLLYRIDRLPTAASVITDVVANTNDLGPAAFGKTLACCNAAAGFDAASGLGSINVGGLAGASGALVSPVAAVGLALPRQRHPLAAEHLLADVSCSRRCVMAAYAKIAIGRSRKRVTQFSSLYLLRRRSHRTIRIALDRRTRDELRRALGDHRRVTATIYGAIVDPGGGVVRRTRGRTLRIRH